MQVFDFVKCYPSNRLIIYYNYSKTIMELVQLWTISNNIYNNNNNNKTQIPVLLITDKFHDFFLKFYFVLFCGMVCGGLR